MKALKLYESIGYKKGVASCYDAMGIAYKNKGDLKKAIVYYEKAIKIEKEIGSDGLSPFKILFNQEFLPFNRYLVKYNGYLF